MDVERLSSTVGGPLAGWFRGTAVKILLGRSCSPGRGRVPGTRDEARRFGRRLVGVFLLVSGILIVSGFLFLMHRQADARTDAHRELSAIADLKLKQISNWREERLSDAHFFSRARFIAQDVKRFLDEPNSEGARSGVLQWLDLLKAGDRYHGLALLDSRGNRALAVPADAGEPLAYLADLITRVQKSHEVVVTDLHRDDADGFVHVDVVLPIFRDADWSQPAPMAYVLLKLDARQFLFPLVQSWPVPSKTAETLLVRRQRQDVLYLNDLRYRTGAALALRIPLTAPELPAAKVLRGDTNVVEGLDYRGVPVVAAGRLVPGTPWGLVAKMDREEIYAPLRQQTVAAVSVLSALVLASGLMVGFLWRQRNTHYLEQELTERLAHERAVERMNRLYAALSAVNQAVVRASSREELLHNICRALVQFGGCQMAWVGALDPMTQRVLLLGQFGDDVGSLQRTGAIADEHGPLATAIREGHPWISDYPPGAPTQEKPGIISASGSMAAFPIRQEGSIRGALGVYAGQKDFFGPEEQALMEEAANDVSFGLDTLLKDQQRKHAESELRVRNSELEAERARWRGVVEGIADEVWTCDAQGQMSLMNLPAVTAIGLEEFKALDVADVLKEVEIFNPDGTPRLARDSPLLRSLRGEVVRGEEIMQHRRTGRRRWRQYSSAPTRDGTGEITGAVAIVRDITEQRQTEEAFKRSEEQLRLAALAADIGVWHWKPGTNAVVVSAKWRRLFGVDADAAVTFETWCQSLHPGDRERTVQELNSASQEHRDFNCEYRVVRPDGTTRWVVDRGRASYDEQGRPVAMAGVNVDITERKAAEEALREARDELARANAELESKVQERTAQLAEANANLQSFAHTAAHDLRSPLRSIEGFCSLLAEDHGATLGAEGRSLLHRAQEAAGQMRRLLNDLLEYSQINEAELKLEPVSLKEAVKQALALLEADIVSKHAIVSVGLEALPQVNGHPATVVLLIGNLISNALKFVEPGVCPQIRISAECRGKCVRLDVQDNGIGISAEHLPRMFQPFQRLHGKKAYAGTGLGLAIVRKAAERMRGRVGVDSQPGKGSRFWIELRAASQAIQEN